MISFLYVDIIIVYICVHFISVRGGSVDSSYYLLSIVKYPTEKVTVLVCITLMVPKLRDTRGLWLACFTFHTLRVFHPKEELNIVLRYVSFRPRRERCIGFGVNIVWENRRDTLVRRSRRISIVENLTEKVTVLV